MSATWEIETKVATPISPSDWDDAVVAEAGVARARLPPVAEPSTVIGKVTPAAAAKTGQDAYHLLEAHAARTPPGSHLILPIYSDAMIFTRRHHAAASFFESHHGPCDHEQ